MVSTENLPTQQSSEKRINIDFSDVRRKSFLPANFADSTERHLKAVKVVECNEDDDIFLYMGSDALFENRPVKKFCTSSKYLGQWNKLGIAGKGVYKYPHGVIYDGYFNKNGQFHGTGILVYPNGQRIEGIWKNGKLSEDSNFVTGRGIMMSKNYCVMPDRRFQIEIENDFNPAGNEFLTDELPPPRVIPDNCYDVVDGFFDPKVKTVYAFPKELKSSRTNLSDTPFFNNMASIRHLTNGEDEKITMKSKSEGELNQLMMMNMCMQTKTISWIPSSIQEDWIVRNCRKGWDEATGYRPDLYEDWTKGGITFSDRLKYVPSSEFVSKLETLKLTEKKPANDRPRFFSFVQNQIEKESLAIEMVTQMFWFKVGQNKKPWRSRLESTSSKRWSPPQSSQEI